MTSRPHRRTAARIATVAATLAAAVRLTLLAAGCTDTTSGRGGDRPAATSGAAGTSTRAVGSAPSSGGASPGAPNSSISGTSTCRSYIYGRPARPVRRPPLRPVHATTMVLTLAVGSSMVRHRLVITLAAGTAPCAVSNLAHLAAAVFYDRTRCHRLTTRSIYVLQCGDPTGTGAGGPGYRFPDELSRHETYPAGTVAMAGSGPNTSGSQFFIVYRDAPLQPSYTVLGHVRSGLGEITAIAAAGAQTGNAVGDGPPRRQVRVVSVTAS